MTQTKIVPYWKLVQALVYMAEQYLQRLDGTIDHQFMTAGECAVECLEQLGFCGEFTKMNEYDDTDSWFMNKFGEAAPIVESEPVAWLWLQHGQKVNAFIHKPFEPDEYFKNKGFTSQPLYTHPDPRTAQLEAKLKLAREAMQDFVNKVDRDETRSAEGYAKFKEALNKIGDK